MRQYAMLFEQANDGGWGAYVPDLPGLGVVGDSREEAHELIVEGVKIHIAGMVEDGLLIPEPSSYAALIDVAA